MLDQKEAIKIVKKNLPDGAIQKIVIYNGLYLFQVFNNRPGEEEMDPFFSVDMKNGRFAEFSIITDGPTHKIVTLFQKAKKIGDD